MRLPSSYRVYFRFGAQLRRLMLGRAPFWVPGLALLAGCFSPSYGEGGFLCSSGSCPDGYQCVEEENPDEPGQMLDVCRAGDLTSGPPELTMEAQGIDVLGAVTVRHGGQLQLTFAVQNFRFAPEKAGQAAVDGEGHIHLHLDGPVPVGYLNPPGPVLTLEVTLDIDDRFSTGPHTLIAALTRNNHQLVQPPVTAELPIRVLAASD